MTGFGHAERTIGRLLVQMDVKTVNHRYSEVSIRMPREWIRHEDSLRKTIAQSVKRGRVDAFVTFTAAPDEAKQVSVNWELAKRYMDAAALLKDKFGLRDEVTLQHLLSVPELLQVGTDDAVPDEQLQAELTLCMSEALIKLEEMRLTEGRALAEDLRIRLRVCRTIRDSIAEAAPTVAEEYRERLHGRVQEALHGVSVDEPRLLTEVALLAERWGIDEELTRLTSHFSQFGALLQEKEPVGRKLDFLIQEMNRETNTIGSKANHAELTNFVVDLKAELEKMREQVQNIE